MIEASKIHNIQRVEDCLSKLYAGGEEHDLRLPAHLNQLKFGGLAAAIQFVITWSRKYPDASLHTYVQSGADVDQQVDSFSLWDHWLVAVLVASKVVASDGRTVRGQALRAAQRRLEEMQSAQGPRGKGPERLYLCATGNLNVLSDQLYVDVDKLDPSVRSNSGFSSLIERMFRSLPFTTQLDSSVVPRVATILVELFKNTHQWARTDLNGKEIRPAVRGIRLEVLFGGREQLQAYVEGVPSLHGYISSVPSSDDDKLYFVEASVFDSGLGMAQRIQNREIQEDGLDGEYSAVVRCLKKMGVDQPT